MREMPRRGERRPRVRTATQVRRRDRHRPAKAIADQRGGLADARAARAAATVRHGRRRRARRGRAAAPQSSSSARRPMRAIAAASDTCSSRSRICGGLISDGTSTAGGPVAAMIAQACTVERARFRAWVRRGRVAAPSRRRASPASASRASSGSRSPTPAAPVRETEAGAARGARSCCSALCSGSRASPTSFGSDPWPSPRAR